MLYTPLPRRYSTVHTVNHIIQVYLDHEDQLKKTENFPPVKHPIYVNNSILALVNVDSVTRGSLNIT